MRLNDTTRAYFEKLGRHQSAGARRDVQGAARSPNRRQALRSSCGEHSPCEYSMLRTSVVPTMLKAGVAANVIPSEAEATLDIRALPDEDVDAVLCGNGEGDRRPGGEDRAAAADPAAVPGIHASTPRCTA